MPILTLTSDIGLSDYIAGAIKGQLLHVNPTFNVVDISHQLSPYNYLQAAYVCGNAFKYYPVNTFHIVLVNVFEYPPTHLLIAKHNNQYIACPDNGVLTMITGYKPKIVAAVDIPQKESIGLLHYTQVIAETANQLYKGIPLKDLGAINIQIKEQYAMRYTVGPNWMDGYIIFIDNFENVVVDITYDAFEEQRKGRKYQIVIPHSSTIDTISANYGSVPDGTIMAWFNSAGYLELAINKGNMAGLFGLQDISKHLQKNKFYYQKIKIIFSDE